MGITHDEIFKNILWVLDFRISKILFRKFPVMKYRYEEDEEPDEFFVPYCWSIIYNSCPHIGWDVANVRLFSIDSYV